METQWLGEDEWGIWLVMPEDARRWKGEVERSPVHSAGVFCVPHDGWWVLYFNGGNTNLSHFIDVATPAVWSDGRVETIDLDLDVIIHQDGTVEIEDEDEFALHQVELGYPDELIVRAREETDRLFAAVSRREEPFFDGAASWLERI